MQSSCRPGRAGLTRHVGGRDNSGAMELSVACSRAAAVCATSQGLGKNTQLFIRLVCLATTRHPLQRKYPNPTLAPASFRWGQFFFDSSVGRSDYLKDCKPPQAPHDLLDHRLIAFSYWRPESLDLRACQRQGRGDADVPTPPINEMILLG